MKCFFCRCGLEIFFSNSHCLNCQRAIAFYPPDNTLLSLDAISEDHHRDALGRYFRYCQNHLDYGVCSSVVADNTDFPFCTLCTQNRKQPDTSNSRQLRRWGKTERAKQRLYYSLASLGLHRQLPLFDLVDGPATTGYHQGVITINLREADDIERALQKSQHGESYRTVLGHMRHEIGHFLLEQLPVDQLAFTHLFGNPQWDYQSALQAYYRNGPLPGWEQQFISAYASAHPLEDWAESFAHYLHITDLAETGQAYQLTASVTEHFDSKLQFAARFGPVLNELNRSLGLDDAYPFVFSRMVTEKLQFIDRTVQHYVHSQVQKQIQN
jgi:hypothetical protein